MNVTDYVVLAVALWVAVGLVVACVADSLMGGRRTIVYDVILGLVASLFGGYFSSAMMGDATKGQLIVSVLCAAFLSGAAVYIFNRIILRENRR